MPLYLRLEGPQAEDEADAIFAAVLKLYGTPPHIVGVHSADLPPPPDRPDAQGQVFVTLLIPDPEGKGPCDSPQARLQKLKPHLTPLTSRIWQSQTTRRWTELT